MSFLRYVVPRWTIAGVLALCIAPVVADITLPAVATPQVDSSNVRVVHGAQGQIILRAHYFGAGTLRFIIREKPAHGALSTPRPAGENQASVTYTNNGKLPLAPDRFTYVAETTGGQSSTIAEVQIDVVEAPPALQMPDSLAFEKIMAGQTEKRTLIIANTGGGLLTGSIIASHPWSVSRPSFRLGPGETESLTVLFQPDEAKNFVGQITVTAANLGEKIVQLAGEAETPVTFQPAQLRLALLQDGTNVRAGHATIKNELGESVKLKITAGRCFRVANEIELGPRETRSLQVEAVPDCPLAMSEPIVFAAPNFTARLVVQAGALPARVVLKSDTRIDFPASKAGELREATVVLKNLGGQSAALRLRAPMPFRLLERADPETPFSGEATLAPLETLQVQVVFSGDRPGKVSAPLTVLFDGGSIEIPLSARVIDPAAAAREIVEAPIAPSIQESTPAPTSTVRETPFPAEPVRNYITGVEKRRLNFSQIELQWLAPSERVSSYHIEKQTLAFDANGNLQVEWTQIPSAKISAREKRMAAIVQGINADTAHVLRISALDPSGSVMLQSRAVPIIPSAKPPPPWNWWLIIFLLTLAALGTLRFRQR